MKQRTIKMPMNEMVHLGGVLFVITFVVALLLGWVNAITTDKIDAIKAQKIADAMSELIPDAQFEEQNGANDPTGVVTAVYKATKSGQEAGYCVQVEPTGFGGKLTVIVGIDAGQKLTGIKITSQTETAGLGTKATEPDFYGQYAGKSSSSSQPLEVIKNGTPANNQIVAISGATITSKAVTSGVNAACEYVAALQNGTPYDSQMSAVSGTSKNGK